MTFDVVGINPVLHRLDQAIVIDHGIVSNPEILDKEGQNGQIGFFVAYKYGFVIIEEWIHVMDEFRIVSIDQQVSPCEVLIILTVEIQLPLEMFVTDTTSAA